MILHSFYLVVYINLKGKVDFSSQYFFSVYGRDVLSVVEQPFDIQDINTVPQGKNTVTYEARYLKALFLKLQMS